MLKSARKLRFKILTSREFSVGAPLIIEEIKKRHYEITRYSDDQMPDYNTLLDCDVYFDMSSITEGAHYIKFQLALDHMSRLNGTTPLLIDPPLAVINALDKRLTNELFHDLVPRAFNLDGTNNSQIISNFNGEFVVIKSPIGWGGRGVERVRTKEAFLLTKNSKGLIMQEYIEPIYGVGRILTLNYKGDFQILCAYNRISKSWKVGMQSKYKCELKQLDSKLTNFAYNISAKSGLYLNGIDYIESADGKLYLLEVNSVPAIKEPMDEFGLNTPKLIIDHIERSVLISRRSK
jgi:glutathione synthase/RimK-type ligase-like ATP-grasp enzyme